MSRLEARMRKTWLEPPRRIRSAKNEKASAPSAQTERRGGAKERAQRAETLRKRGRTCAGASAASASTVFGRKGASAASANDRKRGRTCAGASAASASTGSAVRPVRSLRSGRASPAALLLVRGQESV